MLYLKSFTLPSRKDEDGYLLSFPYQLEMGCYSHNDVYPFKLFPQKELKDISFEPITIFYGGNGSGKSTLLNVIAEKLDITRSSLFNDTPYMVSYLDMCKFSLAMEAKKVPTASRKITSDDVFDFLLDVRAVNEGIDRRREELLNEHYFTNEAPMPRFSSLAEHDEFKRCLEAKRSTKSAYVSRRLPKELAGKSNGESAFVYFTQKIEENALYLLDEPENSLSPKLQQEMVSFLEDSARFYGCQFVISTHSPFLLAAKGAKIYDLDSNPVTPKKWFELENVRTYHDFFKKHTHLF
ncbi:MAG: AAA family ATPase [Clostridia bacterium]|nr:AAA family ATPase [Clostridia bacterium]